MASVREDIIVATCRLLEKQGYPATGLNEIVRESGAPKGSLYHYFPEGKDQIVSEAIRFAGQILVERMRAELAKVDNPMLSIYKYIMHLADMVEEKHFLAGNPLTIVSVEAAGTNERISQSCRDIYDQIEAVLAEKIKSCGISEMEASEQALLVLASLEGGIILSRAHRTVDPLRTIAQHVRNSLLGSASDAVQQPGIE